MNLDRKTVTDIAKLARLELSVDELDAMTVQINSIVAYVEQLQQVDTKGVEPLAHPVEVHNVFREDDPGTSLPVDVALANAPARHGNFYRVPAVLDQ